MIKDDQIIYNPDGWGPVTEPALLKNIPFAPYSKSEKLGRAADWGQSSYSQKQHARQPHRDMQQHQQQVFSFQANEEEDSFQLVDSKAPSKKTYSQQRKSRTQQQSNRQSGGGGQQQQQQRNQSKQQRKSNYGHRDQQRQVQYTSSVDVRPEWQVVTTLNFAQLAGLKQDVQGGEVLRRCGSVEYYDRGMDQVTPKDARPLKKTKRVFRSVTTSDDPIMRQLAQDGEGHVFITDSILTTLMTLERSVYSFDVVITRVHNKLFFDKREGRQAQVDLLTVNETAPEPVVEDRTSIYGVHKVSLEATAINQNFSQQALRQGNRYSLGESNPFADASDVDLASVGYLYKRFKLPDGRSCIVRCEVDGVVLYREKVELVLIRALNEYLSGGVSTWRHDLETQKLAVLAMQMKNNQTKLAKTAAQALLAGTDLIRFGFVTRTNPRDIHNHVILACLPFKASELAQQMDLQMSHCWGVLQFLLDTVAAQQEGKYLLLREPGNPNQYNRDPSKELLRLYRVPDNAFDSHYPDDGGDDDAGEPSMHARVPQA